MKGLPIYLKYQDQPRKLYADCDILIDPQNLLLVKQLLSKQGFKSQSDYFLSFSADKTEITFGKVVKGFNILLDIHLKPVFLMVRLPNLDFFYPEQKVKAFNFELWKNKKKVRLKRDQFYLLESNCLVVYLALHLFHSNFRGYSQYELLDAVLNSKSINLQKIIILIKKYQFEKFVFPIFCVLAEDFSNKQAKRICNALELPKMSKFFIKLHMSSLSVYAGQHRLFAGIERFVNLFLYSPVPLHNRLLVIFSSQVWRLIGMVSFLYAFSVIKRLRFFIFSINPFKSIRAVAGEMP